MESSIVGTNNYASTLHYPKKLRWNQVYITMRADEATLQNSMRCNKRIRNNLFCLYFNAEVGRTQ